MMGGGTKMPARQALARTFDEVVAVDGLAARLRPDPLGWPDYDRARDDAAEASGTDESVTVADVRVGSAAAVAVAWDFGYLGGSMGSVAGARIAGAFDRARERGVPIVLLTSTGGARMQEGMASLVQMAATTVAARRHAAAGLLQVAVLGHPTTGGVFASHANLADVVMALPGATIGFAGPRVAEAMTGGPLPEHSHTAAGARAAGLVDAVVEPADVRAHVARLLTWAGRDDAEAVTAPAGPPDRTLDAWDAVQASRAAGRPRATQWLAGVDVAAELHGDRAGADDPAVRVCLARLRGRRIVVVALDRDGRQGRVGPAGYRKAWRGLALADRLDVPVVTLVDTPGADAGAAAEAGGIAHHIAATFARLLEVRSPTVAVVTGEGGSGGALALAVTDRLNIGETATFSVIGVEGAAAILHRDPARAPEVAARLRPDAFTLRELGIADRVLPEAVDPVRAGWDTVAAQLAELGTLAGDERLATRWARWRTAGQPE